MSYKYKSQTIAELENLANGVLSKYPARIKNFHVHIEGILEDMGFVILPRPGIQKNLSIDGYLPRNAKFVLIDDEYGSDLPYFRLVIAEEISHRVIEPILWEKGVPAGANIYEIDKQMYDEIEGDAYRMSLALLMPRNKYIDRFQFHQLEALKINPQNHYADKVRYCVNALANEFEVTFNGAASRGNHIGLFEGQITKKTLPGAVIF